MLNLYEILGVEKSATIQAIRNAFRRKAKALHPDVTGGQVTQEWHQLRIAHDVLSNEKRREFYDETGEIDEQPKDHKEHVALSILSRMMQVMISNKVDLTKIDLKSEGLTFLRQEIVKLDEQLDTLVGAQERAKKIQGRWSSSQDQVNVMESMINAQFQEISRARQNILGHIEAHKRAIEILQSHDFRYDEESQVVQYHTTFYQVHNA